MMAERTGESLQLFSRRLLTVFQIYFRVERCLTRSRVGFGARQDWETHTALVESFAMHTRGLADFFFTFKGSRHDSDAFAFHFFASADEWRSIVGEPGPWLRRVRFRPERGSPEERTDRFGEQVAHLTYNAEPASSFAAGWPTMQLANEIGLAACAFIDHVDDTLVASDFKDQAIREVPVRAKLGDRLMPLVLWTPPTLRGRP